MGIYIEDSLRPNLAGRIISNHADGLIEAAVVTPWATPFDTPASTSQKPALSTFAEKLDEKGVPLWFDPMTHALGMSGVGDFRYYSEYDLWGGPVGDLTTTVGRSNHVLRVFDVQDSVSAPHLAPTLLLHTGLSNDSSLALETARETISLDSSCYLSIAGTATFWASGSALDAHIGALAELEPAGWFLTVVRPSTDMPVQTHRDEVAGLNRTTRALSEDAPVHISHGDLAALPAVAAGASSVGTGWDQRQRMCSYSDYAVRDPDGGGGQWFARPTLRGLVGSLFANEAFALNSRNAGLAAQLGGLPTPGPSETYRHHLQVLTSLIDAIQGEPTYEARAILLAQIYANAAAAWPAVQALTNCAAGATEWISEVQAGLALYAVSEGW